MVVPPVPGSLGPPRGRLFSVWPRWNLGWVFLVDSLLPCLTRSDHRIWWFKVSGSSPVGQWSPLWWWHGCSRSILTFQSSSTVAIRSFLKGRGEGRMETGRRPECVSRWNQFDYTCSPSSASIPLFVYQEGEEDDSSSWKSLYPPSSYSSLLIKRKVVDLSKRKTQFQHKH